MKKIISHTILLSVMLFFSLAGVSRGPGEVIEFTGNEVFIPARLGKLRLCKDDAGFFIIKDERIYNIQNCFCDSKLLSMSNYELKIFLGRDKPKMHLEMHLSTPEEFSQLNLGEMVEVTGAEKDNIISQLRELDIRELDRSSGYIQVNQMDNGEYVLHAQSRLLGGSLWGWFKEGGIFSGAVATATAYTSATTTVITTITTSTEFVVNGVWMASPAVVTSSTAGMALMAPGVIAVGVCYLGIKAIIWLVRRNATETPTANPDATNVTPEVNPHTSESLTELGIPDFA